MKRHGHTVILGKTHKPKSILWEMTIRYATERSNFQKQREMRFTLSKNDAYQLYEWLKEQIEKGEFE